MKSNIEFRPGDVVIVDEDRYYIGKILHQTLVAGKPFTGYWTVSFPNGLVAEIPEDRMNLVLNEDLVCK